MTNKLTQAQLDGAKLRMDILKHALRYGCEQSIRQAFTAHARYCRKIGINVF